MKKTFLKRALALGLAAAMTVGMCACGGKDGEGDGGSGSGKKDGKNTNAALAKEHVYRGEDITISDQIVGANNCYCIASFEKEDAVYAFMENYSYDDETYESSEAIQMYVIPKDGSAAKAVTLDTPDCGSSYDEETQAYDYCGYSHYLVGTDGTVYGIKTQNHEKYSEEGYSSESTYALCSWDANGTLLASNEIEGLKSTMDEYMYINRIFMGTDGKVQIFTDGNTNKVITVNTDGTVLQSGSMNDGVAEIFNNMERAFDNGSGTVTVLGHNLDDWQKVFLVDYDIATGKFGEKRELPGNILAQWDYGAMAFGNDGTLYFSNSNGVYKYKDGDADPTLVFDYVNSDVYINNLSFLVPVGTDSFIAMYNEDWSGGMKTKKFTYVKPEDIVDKTVLLMATDSGFDYDLKKRVIEFNRNSNTLRIVMKDYSIYNSYDDGTQGYTRMNNDIISGNIPDILCSYSYSNLPVDSYIAKGMFTDLYPLLKKDAELSQVEFMQNVFDAASVDGKMYKLVPSFSVSTIIAKKSLVGGLNSWTMADAKAVLNKMAPDAVLFDSTIQSSFLSMAMNYGGKKFIDVNTGKCDFNNQEFVDILEYAKTLPADYTYDYDEDYDWTAEETKFRENRCLLMNMYLYDFSNIGYQTYGRMGEEGVFVGFPGSDVKGYLSFGTSYLISSKCSDIDGAWSFLRYYLTDEYQANVWELPVKKDLLLKKAQEATERPYWTDENGNKQYYDNTYWLNGEEVIIEPLTQAQVDEVVNFISSLDTSIFVNDSILNIITEEAGAFFSGQKPAKDVADVIQRRVQMYVDENR